MRVAILHDILIEFGGAEQILIQLLKMYPKADIYTLYNNKKMTDVHFRNIPIKSSFLSYISLKWFPGKYWLLRFAAIFWWRTLILESYDLVIVSYFGFNSWSSLSNEKGKKIIYLHDLPGRLNSQRNIFIKALKKMLLTILYFFYYSPKAESVVSNSIFVQDFVASVLDVNSQVVYPPIRQSNVKKKKKAIFYLLYSRLVDWKNTELVIKVCRKKNIPLLVVGDGEMKSKLQMISGRHTYFLGRKSLEEVTGLVPYVKALITASENEPFGMAIAEILATGTPVIGYDSGAIREIITKENGILFKKLNSNSLVKAIKKFESISDQFKAHSVSQSVKKFNVITFEENIRTLVAKSLT